MNVVDAGLIADNYRALRERVDQIGGVNVGIVAVTKTFPIEAVRAVQAAGCRLVGENYAQELVAKFAGMAPADRPEIHFIGQLQSNKVRVIAPLVSVWQTVDRASVIDEISRRAPGATVMVQVNATGEAEKGGCRPDDVESLVERATRGGLHVNGLMTVGPTGGDTRRTRSAFRVTAGLARALALPELSMGMSGDWEIGVEEGATLIRIGSAIFGDRPPVNP